MMGRSLLVASTRCVHTGLRRAGACRKDVPSLDRGIHGAAALVPLNASIVLGLCRFGILSKLNILDVIPL